MTEYEKMKIPELRASGMGYKAIANVLGLSRDAVRGFCRKYGLNGNAEVMQKNNVLTGSIEMNKPEDLYCRSKYRATFVPENFKDRFENDVPKLMYENMFLKVMLHCPDGVNVVNDEPIRFELEAFNLIPCQ